MSIGPGAIEADVTSCRACPRLVEWREQVAVEKRAAFADQTYWGRPVPGFGDPDARIVLLGLAPAAHGANRTGRMFTGDRSGDWLYAALHRAGLANQPTAVAVGDGLKLNDVYITAPVKCAPPANKPTPLERDTCVSKWLLSELTLLSNKRVVLCLGRFAYDIICSIEGVKSRPKFGHGVETTAPSGLHILCSFHPSQQNTFTGKLTVEMTDTVLTRAKQLSR